MVMKFQKKEKEKKEKWFPSVLNDIYVDGNENDRSKKSLCLIVGEFLHDAHMWCLLLTFMLYFLWI